MSLPMGELKHRLYVQVPSRFGRSTAAHVLHHEQSCVAPATCLSDSAS